MFAIPNIAYSSLCFLVMARVVGTGHVLSCFQAAMLL